MGRKLFYKGENNEENLIFEVLKEEAFVVDKIIEKNRFLISQSSFYTLAVLEIKGKIRNLGGNIYTILR